MPRTAVHPVRDPVRGGIRAGCFLVRQQKCFGLPAVFAGAAGGVGGRGMSCVCVVGICGRAGWATALLSAKAGGEIRKGRWEALRGVGRCGGRGGMSGRDGWVVGARAYVACVEGRSVFVGARWGVFFWFVFEDF